MVNKETVNVKGEWRFIEHDPNGNQVSDTGWLENFITAAGLELIASEIQGLSSPYLVIGSDTAPGETITEVYRQAVSVVARSGALVRFRTVILAANGNGTHQKASLFYGATAVAGTGTMFNLLKQPFSKTSNTILTVEVKITISQ